MDHGCSSFFLQSYRSMGLFAPKDLTFPEDSLVTFDFGHFLRALNRLPTTGDYIRFLCLSHLISVKCLVLYSISYLHSFLSVIIGGSFLEPILSPLTQLVINCSFLMHGFEKNRNSQPNFLVVLLWRRYPISISGVIICIWTLKSRTAKQVSEMNR